MLYLMHNVSWCYHRQVLVETEEGHYHHHHRTKGWRGGQGERERERIIAINTELKNWQELTVFYYKGNANHQ